MSDTKDKRSTALYLHTHHKQMAEELCEALPSDQIELMKRTLKLSVNETRGSKISGRDAIMLHALTVGLRQLLQTLTIDPSYHRLATIELSSMLHSCIQGQGELSLEDISSLLSSLENARNREASPEPQPNLPIYVDQHMCYALIPYQDVCEPPQETDD